MDEVEASAAAARVAADHLLRVTDRALGARRAEDAAAGSGSLFEQVARGDFDRAWSGEAAAENAAALMSVTAERVRGTRVQVERLVRGRSRDEDGVGIAIADAAAARLPLNRKERYYTGTVLPMLAFSDDFAHVGRLLDLCGLSGVDVPSDGAELGAMQAFTEYSFAESVFTGEDRARFEDRPAAADTPDLLLAGPDWLLAIEAKFYDQPSAADLRRQLDGQAVLVDYWQRTFGLASARVRHIALLPASLADRVGAMPTPVVTWEELSEAYSEVGPRYWTAMLRTALRAPLFSPEDYGFGANKHDSLTGASIVAGVTSGQLAYTTMGRAGGLDGRLLAADLATGAWQEQTYEVRRDGLPNRNWFAVADFVARISSLAK